MPRQLLGRAGGCSDRVGCGVRVCMYIYVYVINIYVYMYIRVCAKHARVHRFNANSAPNEEEGALSADVVLDSAALGPRPLLRAAGFGPALLAPSFPPALCPVIATA